MNSNAEIDTYTAPLIVGVERPLLVHHVAKLTGCAYRTVRHLAQTDKLHGFKLGKKIWGFRRADVERFRRSRHGL
jgi:Helix-turn-helix domain